MELTLGVEPTQRPVIECPLVAFREPTGALRALGNGFGVIQDTWKRSWGFLAQS